MVPAPPLVDTLLAFVREIGLEVRETAMKHPTFLPGILLERGRLLVDRSCLLYPGDLLHEAGHLAVTPADERVGVGGNITEHHPEKGGDELAVLAWTYAACCYLDLPPTVVFHPDGYKGQAEWLVEQYESGGSLGLPLLVWMGLTTAADFPRMHRWLRA
ncbi:hypothetical protein [Hymenobacter sp. 102]|uniref:hypothetical protein n=1 Tax=Hymenobacter sp. 102 TaxID=3403152 RepID=UPI003CF29C1C